METLTKKRTAAPQVSTYWDEVQKWNLNNAQRYELGLMLLGSLEPVFVESEEEEDFPMPYTIEELHARIAESEKQFAAGEYMDFDEAMDEIESELKIEEPELEMAEAV
ncbi:MAG: hypothetical protein IKO99_03040 [Bacteroidales bacterium]|nr:hypothetical protein [Bacteroidales bacterium]